MTNQRHLPRARRGTRRGQVLPIVAIAFVVLLGFTSLALDGGHLYLLQYQAQKAADAAVLAASKRLGASVHDGPPANSSDPAVTAAHDLAQVDGFPTTLGTGCDATATSGGISRFSTTWHDTAVTCAATSGWSYSVTVYAPPQVLTTNCTARPYSCMQVVVTQRVQNYLLGALGQPYTNVSASATGLGQPAWGSVNLPNPISVYLYEPSTANGCNAATQTCFDRTHVPSRSNLSCTGGNCPTFWEQLGANVLIAGVDATTLSPAQADTVAFESNGDMVLQDTSKLNATFCDPYGGASCKGGSTTGSKGFAIATGAKLYCNPFTGNANGLTACTTAGPGGAAVGELTGNEVAFASQSWSPTVNTNGLTYCGGLVLNGGPVATSFTTGPGCAPSSTDPYSLLPGQYDYIVVNHGAYHFEAGLYDIIGKAPVNTNTSGFANGIDHATETSADWDLCTGAAGSHTACPTLTAGVWIGHGSLSYTAAGSSSSASCTAGGPTQAGGGDPTDVTGNGVTFRLESLSGGFVSTNEADAVGLASPGIGGLQAVSGVPLLIDMENNSFIHLDANSGSKVATNFVGLVYQMSSATGGGVEIDPGLDGKKPVFTGQVLAYSLTTFGTGGAGVDFGQGPGGGTLPSVTTSGKQEPAMISNVKLVSAGAGTESVVIQYGDEWRLDAYDVYIKINSNSPVYFSQGIWNPVPGAGTPLPPATNTPGDSNPALPVSTQDPSNHYTQTTVAGSPSWAYTFADGSKMTIVGDWAWGHEKDIALATSSNNQATITYTVSTPAGSTVTVTAFMTDGDHCGDYVSATWSFGNLGQPNPGVQVGSAVNLEQ